MPGMQSQDLVTAVVAALRSPEGRAAIAECMRRPPVRMADGTWREPTPGRDAKPGDVVRRIGNGDYAEVCHINSDTLWLSRGGSSYETADASDVEVVIPIANSPTKATL